MFFVGATNSARFTCESQRALGDAPAAHAAAHQAVVSLTASLGQDNALTRDALALE
jgi:hypothetical protein